MESTLKHVKTNAADVETQRAHAAHTLTTYCALLWANDFSSDSNAYQVQIGARKASISVVHAHPCIGLSPRHQRHQATGLVRFERLNKYDGFSLSSAEFVQSIQDVAGALVVQLRDNLVGHFYLSSILTRTPNKLHPAFRRATLPLPSRT